MTTYLVSARKYRPVTFDSVVGQSSLTTTLKNSITSGRLAHAYLFCGPRGVGKTTCARIFAKTINCLNPKPNGDACEECESCKAFNEQRSYNIHELDAASNNGVDDIRQLIEQVNIPPQIGKYKVFIVDEVHMLSTAAFNAFLKTLEEPPAHAIFILATTEKHKLLPTILSRCQIYDFQRMTVQNIVGHLENVAKQEGITYEPAALNVIAQKADGGMRDALSIFDQVASFCQGNITYQQTIADLNVLDYEYYFRLVDDFLGNKIPDVMLTLNDILNKGFDGSHFVGGLNTHLRNLLISRDEATVKLLETSDDVRQRYVEQAKRCQPRWLYAAIRKCTDCDLNYRQSQNKRLLVELTLIEIAQAAQPDDGLPSGRRPTKNLKPLFTVAGTTSASSTPVAAAPNAKATATGASSASTSPVAGGSPSSTNPASGAPNANPTAAGGFPASSAKSASTKGSSPAPSMRQGVSSFSILAAKESLGLKPNTSAQAETQTAQASGIPSSELPPLIDEGQPHQLDATSVIVAWRTFASRLPQEENALASRMNNMEPRLQADSKTVEVTADNLKVKKLIDQNAERIMQLIRLTFNKPELQLQVNVDESRTQRVYLSRAEKFRLMCDENEALRKLTEEFALGFGN